MHEVFAWNRPEANLGMRYKEKSCIQDPIAREMRANDQNSRCYCSGEKRESLYVSVGPTLTREIMLSVGAIFAQVGPILAKHTCNIVELPLALVAFSLYKINSNKSIIVVMSIKYYVKSANFLIW